MNTYHHPATQAIFGVSRGSSSTIPENRFMKFIWNDGDDDMSILIDAQPFVLRPAQILCVTYLNVIELPLHESALKTLWFNREFYCVHTYDSEVSCNGLLFFGSSSTPVVQLDTAETIRLRTLFGVLEEEFGIVDVNQEEMLRILLKRFIIRCTRLARKQLINEHATTSDIDLIRQFSYLVEEYFRSKKNGSRICCSYAPLS